MSFRQCRYLYCTNSKCLQETSIYANFQCSKTCDKGVKTREISCRSRTLKGWVILSDSFCQHKPLLAKTRGCRVKKCPPVIEHQWILSSWSQVTKQKFTIHLFAVMTHVNYWMSEWKFIGCMYSLYSVQLAVVWVQEIVYSDVERDEMDRVGTWRAPTNAGISSNPTVLWLRSVRRQSVLDNPAPTGMYHPGPR